MSVLSSGQYYGRIASRREAAGGAVSCLEHSNGRRLPMHVHRQAYFSMVLSGGYREEAGRKSIEYGIMTIVYHPPGTAHVDEISPGGARFLMVEADDDLVAGDDAPARLRSGYPVELPRNASWLALRALGGDGLDTESTVLELLGIACGESRFMRGAPAWLSGALDHVTDEFRSPPSATEIASRAGVHPVHLARVVRRETGMTLADIVRRRRVEHAVRLLAGGAPLASIALDCGFADQPHFTRGFRQETGMSPGETRRLIQA